MGALDDLLEEEKKKKKPSQVAADQNKSATTTSGGSHLDALIESASKAKSTPTSTPSATPTPTKTPQKPAPEKQKSFFEKAVDTIKNAFNPGRDAPTPITTPAPKFDATKINTAPPSGSTLIKPKNLFDTPQVTSASLKVTSKSLADQKRSLDQQDAVFGKIGQVIQGVYDQAQSGINDLSKGVVVGVGQAPTKSEYPDLKDVPAYLKNDPEYMKQYKTYDQALAESKKPSFLKSINKNLGLFLSGTASSLSLGIVSPDKKNLQFQTGGQEKAYQAGQILPILAVPIKTLVKFIAVDTVFRQGLKQTTGKENISGFLPEGTSPGVIKGVDALQLLGEGLLAHGIKPGKITDAFTKTTLEKYNIPSDVTITNSMFKDIYQTGKLTTAEQKSMIRDLKLTPDETKSLLKSDKDLVIPASKVTYIVDRPYWAKVKGMFKMDESKPIQVDGKANFTTKNADPALLTETAGENPTFTPDQLRAQVEATDLSGTKIGDEISNVISIAEKRGKSVQITVNPEQGNLFKNPTPAGTRLGYQLVETQPLQLLAENPKSAITSGEGFTMTDKPNKENLAVGKKMNDYRIMLDRYNRNPTPTKLKQVQSLRREIVAAGEKNVAPIETAAAPTEAPKAPAPQFEAISQDYFIHQASEGGGSEFSKVAGTQVDIAKGVDTFIYKNPDPNNPEWVVSEAKTGLKISAGSTKASAIDEARSLITQNKEKVDNLVQTATDENGISPRYKVIAGETPAIPVNEPITVKSTDELLTYIDRQGFRTPEQIDALKKDILANGIKYPIELILKANGTFEINDGTHRIQIAKDLGIKELPIRVVRTEKPIGKTEPASSKPIEKPEAKQYPNRDNVDNNGKTPSKIAKSIEIKAIEQGLTRKFENIAGYDKITIEEQAAKAAELMQDLEKARAVIRGEEPLPQGLRGTSLITAAEEYIKKTGDADFAYDLANSPLVSQTSLAAQELRLAAEREPDSVALKLKELKDARELGLKNRTGNTVSEALKLEKAKIKEELKRTVPKKDEWADFIKSIEC